MPTDQAEFIGDLHQMRSKAEFLLEHAPLEQLRRIIADFPVMPSRPWRRCNDWPTA